MSNESAKNLNREKNSQLLAAIGSQSQENNSQDEVTEYNWHCPHCFSTDQLKKLTDFSKKIAAITTLKLNSLCQCDFTITIESTTQHFAVELFGQNSEGDQNYYLAFTNNQGPPFGFICIPSKTALAWTTQLLGETETEQDETKPLSLLEESLLLDISLAIIESLSHSHDSYNLKPAEIVIKGQAPFYMEGTEELCKINFGIQEGESEKNEYSILIICNHLESVVGESDQVIETFSDKEVSKAIIDRLNKMSVTVTAQLASASLTFEEVMGLQSGDIVLLDRKVDEPIEVIAENEIVFYGQPAKSAGKHAVVITKVCNNSI